MNSISTDSKYRVPLRGGSGFRDIQSTPSRGIINIRGNELYNNNNKHASTGNDNA